MTFNKIWQKSIKRPAIVAFATVGFAILSLKVSAQTQPAPPPPPPSPGEVFNSINPFKKHHKTDSKAKKNETASKENTTKEGATAAPAGPQPPPPPGEVINKLNPFKKNKKATTPTPPPPPPATPVEKA